MNRFRHRISLAALVTAALLASIPALAAEPSPVPGPAPVTNLRRPWNGGLSRPPRWRMSGAWP